MFQLVNFLPFPASRILSLRKNQQKFLFKHMIQTSCNIKLFPYKVLEKGFILGNVFFSDILV